MRDFAKIIGIIASIATIIATCITAIALIPAFGQWLSPREPVPAITQSLPTPTLTYTPSPISTPSPTSTFVPPTLTYTPSSTSTPVPPTPENIPKFGSITFALGATDTYEPINAGTTFDKGITEIHAIFDYSGMLSTYTWERVWYLDGKEILRNSAQWTDKESGTSHYWIDAGGDTLSPGEWILELYVEGKLATTGKFFVR